MEDLKNIIKIVGCLVGGLLFFYFYPKIRNYHSIHD